MIPWFALLWLMGSLVIGFLGRTLRFGFWGYFFGSMLLSPALGLLLLIAGLPYRPKARRS